MAKSRRRLPKKTQKAVDKELRKWYRQIGDSYFERTQQTCPEVTGQLKDSGRIVHHRGGQSSGGATLDSDVRSTICRRYRVWNIRCAEF